MTLPRKTIKQSSPQPITPMQPPVQAKPGSRPNVRQSENPSAAPNNPPISATAHFIRGYVAAAATNPPRIPDGNGPPVLPLTSTPTIAPINAALSSTSGLNR